MDTEPPQNHDKNSQEDDSSNTVYQSEQRGHEDGHQFRQRSTGDAHDDLSGYTEDQEDDHNREQVSKGICQCRRNSGTRQVNVTYFFLSQGSVQLEGQDRCNQCNEQTSSSKIIKGQASVRVHSSPDQEGHGSNQDRHSRSHLVMFCQIQTHSKSDPECKQVHGYHVDKVKGRAGKISKCLPSLHEGTCNTRIHGCIICRRTDQYQCQCTNGDKRNHCKEGILQCNNIFISTQLIRHWSNVFFNKCCEFFH